MIKYTKDLILIAILTAILIIQEQILFFIPNIQLTFFLLVLYSKKLNLSNTIIICFIYVILDNLLSGYFNIIYIPFMLIGLLLIPISMNTLFKNIESNITLSILGILFSLVYSWSLVIPGCIVFQMDLFTYLKGDIIWEIILAASSFVTILLLYKPCAKVFDKFYKKRDFLNS